MPESNKLALVSDATAALQTTSSLPSNKCITYQEMLDMIESAGGGGSNLPIAQLKDINDSGSSFTGPIRYINCTSSSITFNSLSIPLGSYVDDSAPISMNGQIATASVSSNQVAMFIIKQASVNNRLTCWYIQKGSGTIQLSKPGSYNWKWWNIVIMENGR